MKKILLTILIYILTTHLFAQTWTWVKGDSGTIAHGIYGTQGISSVVNKPGSRYNCVSWQGANNDLWLFGGQGFGLSGNSGSLNDLWKYDVNTNEWAWIKGDYQINQSAKYGSQGIAASLNVPGARHNSVSWTDQNNNLWLFGGCADPYGPGKFLNDLWKYNSITSQWTWVNGDSTIDQTSIYGTQGIATTSNKPGGRAAAVSWTDRNGNFWLFGGYQNAGGGYVNFLDDLWEYNPLTNLWKWVKGDNTPTYAGVYGTQGIASAINNPGARYLGASWTDLNGDLWLFGGEGFASASSGFLNDLWKFSPSTNQWTWIKGDSLADKRGIYGSQNIGTAANKPGGRYGSISWTDISGNLWLFGGEGYGRGSVYGSLNDLWRYNPTNNQWTWIKGSNIINANGNYGIKGQADDFNNPSSRWSGVSWIDNIGNLWLFGGEPIFNDLWRLTLPVTKNLPKIYNSNGSLSVGEIQIITGSSFTSNGIATINITGPNGFSQSNTMTATGNGSFAYSFATNNSMPQGIYNIIATDGSSGNSSPVKSFQLINNAASIGTLKITSPSIIASTKVNKTIKLGWTDNPSHKYTNTKHEFGECFI